LRRDLFAFLRLEPLAIDKSVLTAIKRQEINPVGQPRPGPRHVEEDILHAAVLCGG
jgi:hypothetical protein